jgi:uncharacterized protein YacL
MYSHGGLFMIFGVLVSLGFVFGLVWFVNHQIPVHLKKKDWLTRYVALVLTSLLGVFIVDLLVSWDVKLMSDQMRSDLFELIKNIVLVVFGYQFASNKSTDEDDNKNM